MTGLMADYEADLATPFGFAAKSGGGSGKVITVLTLTGAGTYTLPPTAAFIDACGVGAGGPGGGTSSNGGSGGGGGGGAFDSVAAVPVNPSASPTLTYSVGAAGGNDTTVTYAGQVILRASAGSAGGTATGTTGGLGGPGGVANTSAGHLSIPGGAGSNGGSQVTTAGSTGSSAITPIGGSNPGTTGASGSSGTSGGAGGGGGGSWSSTGFGTGGVGTVSGTGTTGPGLAGSLMLVVRSA